MLIHLICKLVNLVYNMRALADQVYNIGTFSNKLTYFCLMVTYMYNLVLKRALPCFSFKFSFYNKVSRKKCIGHVKYYMREYTRQMFFFFFFFFFLQINCCGFLFFGQNLSLFKNQRFLPKILVCEEMYFIETSGKT